MPPQLPRGPITTGPITSSQIKFAVGGLRFDQALSVGWQITPSIGLVAKDVQRLGLDIRSFKEPLVRSVKRVIIPSIRKNFTSGGRPPWAELAPYTITRRTKEGFPAWPPLTKTGRLRRGATQFNIWSIGQTTATVRRLPSSVWYGAIHQSGLGGFAVHAKKAAKELGRGASGMEIFRRALEIMHETTGGPRGEHAAEIPQRQFIMFQEDDIDDIQQVFYEWLVERAVRVGRFSRGR